MKNMMGTPLIDSLSVMMEQESTAHYTCLDYLNEDISCTSHVTKDSKNHKKAKASKRHRLNAEITPDDRMKVVDWCYQIIDDLQFDRETVAKAMDIADRFMCTPESQDIVHHRGDYQLVVVTALYISTKMNEQVVLGSEHIMALSSGLYSVEEVEDMEWRILQGLKWRLCRPTSLQVAHHILSFMMCRIKEKNGSLRQGTWNLIHEEVAFQTEISIRDYYFTTWRPSTIAVASILNAIEQVDNQDYTILIMALKSILCSIDFGMSNKLKEAMDKLLSLVDENSEGSISENSEYVPGTNPQASQESHRMANQHYSEYPERIEENNQEISEYPRRRVSFSDSYNDVATDLYGDTDRTKES